MPSILEQQLDEPQAQMNRKKYDELPMGNPFFENVVFFLPKKKRVFKKKGRILPSRISKSSIFFGPF